ncbi:MAG: hypothetical protein KA152_02905 [Verrucomicrobiales bacterium]|jgi:hypothetical protein|nr:hypothetical protein [Verrucomicrobiales bacterium]HQW30270.1 hypothetical protein [Verrucomicrobiales bacterium]
MNNEIVIITQFLESLGPEVSGHSSFPLTKEQIERIHLFAAGKLSAAERESLLPGILGNEKALHELVQRLQAQS